MCKLIVTLILAFCTPQTQQINLSLAEKILDVSAVIRLKQYRVSPSGQVERGIGGCSGTFVSPDMVLTAGHCFDNPTTEIWVKPYPTRDVSGYAATLEKLDYSHDLALVRVKGYKTKIFAKKALSVRLGEAVISVGSPFRFQFLLSEGIVAQLGFQTKEYKSLYLIHTGMINPGSSGGGAFNSKGELIGVNAMSYGGFMSWAGISLAVSLEDVKEFLK